MNTMNDERFFDLAMKVIARQSSDSERAELDALLASRPELKAEFERLQAEVRIVKEILPLANAVEATAGGFPAYARARLQAKVQETLGRPSSSESKRERALKELIWGWRWWLGLAAAAAMILIVAFPMFRTPNAPVIQLAMLDLGGATRGGDTNEVALLRQNWEKATFDSIPNVEALRAWETDWEAASKRPAVKIVYDRAAGEVRVLGRRKGESFRKTFLVGDDLKAALEQAKTFIAEQTGR